MESPRVLELRRELAELGDPGPGTFDLVGATRASILAELADLGASVVPPAAAPRPIHPPVVVRAHAPAPRPLPPSIPLPAAPAALEKPVDKKPDINPKERLAQLLERLHRNDAASNANAAYQTRGDIRRHCAAHGLPVPPEAKMRQPPKPTLAQRPRLPRVGTSQPPAPALATAPKVSASPAAPAEHGAEPPRAQSAAHHPALGADRPAAPTPSTAAARIRSLRSQALEILPEFEDLSPEAAAQAHDEMDLLARVLVLGGDLIRRRTA